MINSFAILSIIASVALAQQAPSGVSSKCQDFYKSINADSALAACTSSFTAATSGFAPGANSKPSSASISTALTALCSDTNKCPETLVRKTLATFGTDCAADFSNEQVQTLYDNLYALVPIRDAICTKNEDGGWCINSIGQSLDASAKSEVQKYLGAGTTANSEGMCKTNMAFAFLQPSMNTESLCTPCTNRILTSYITWQSNTPYTPGTETSKLLCGETELYKKVEETCGKDFLGGAVQAAGGISSGFGSDSNAAPSLLSNTKAVAVAALGVASFALL